MITLIKWNGNKERFLNLVKKEKKTKESEKELLLRQVNKMKRDKTKLRIKKDSSLELDGK